MGFNSIINSMQEADCVHGKDWNLSQKKEKERKQKSMVKVA